MFHYGLLATVLSQLTMVALSLDLSDPQIDCGPADESLYSLNPVDCKLAVDMFQQTSNTITFGETKVHAYQSCEVTIFVPLELESLGITKAQAAELVDKGFDKCGGLASNITLTETVNEVKYGVEIDLRY